MKTTILKSMMAVLMALSSLSVYAYDVEIDGIYYNLNKGEKTAEVTYKYENDNSTAYFGNVVIPTSIENDGVTYSVTSISVWAFSGCEELTSITIPNSVTSIGDDAFSGCSSLTSVNIPNSVTSIGGGAFQNCSGLTSITIPNSVTSIGGYAFSYCSGLTSITIPNSVTSIDEHVFYGCI